MWRSVPTEDGCCMDCVGWAQDMCVKCFLLLVGENEVGLGMYGSAASVLNSFRYSVVWKDMILVSFDTGGL